MNEFSEIINSFDKKVKNREIFDYKIVLDTSANDSFIVYENIFTSDYVINLNNQGVISDEDLDLKKHELILNEDLKENETLKIIIFKEDKLEKSDSSTGKIYSFYFNNGYNYKINSSV
ncbi:MAG: hypothetical protein LBQ59_03060 [Candidatus Peribacteria bacterium]|jgi:hypothetical protein|nr:hypothetical protein [Candidatus Peribacteria bacterium]